MNKNNKAAKIVKKVTKVRRRIRRNQRRVRRIARRIKNLNRRTRGLRLAQRANFRGFMKIVKSDYNSLTVSGVDMVYKMTSEEQIMETDVLALIPANPAYWTGTRISALASVYQQYRPLKFTVQYIPSTGATRDGNIIAGSLWNMVPPSNGIEQALMGVPGSMTTQVFMKASARVPLKSNLPQNLFNIGGEFNDKSNPFIYVALSKGNVVDGKKYRPGFFVVHYTYLFKNPLPVSSVFENQGLVKYKDLVYRTNTALYMCSDKDDQNPEDTQLDKFQLIQVNRSGNEDANELNGQFVSIDPESYVWVLSNYSKDDAQQPQPQPQPSPIITKNIVFTDYDLIIGEPDDYYTDAYGIYCYPSGPIMDNGECSTISLLVCGGDPKDILGEIGAMKDQADGQIKRWVAIVKPDELSQLASARAMQMETGRVHPYYDDPDDNRDADALEIVYPTLESSGWQKISVTLLPPNKNKKVRNADEQKYDQMVKDGRESQIIKAPKPNKKLSNKITLKPIKPFNTEENEEEKVVKFTNDTFPGEDEIIPIEEMLLNKGKCVKGMKAKKD